MLLPLVLLVPLVLLPLVPPVLLDQTVSGLFELRLLPEDVLLCILLQIFVTCPPHPLQS